MEQQSVVVKNRVGRPHKGSPPRVGGQQKPKLSRKKCIKEGCQRNCVHESQVCSFCRMKEEHYHRDYHRVHPCKKRQEYREAANIKKMIQLFDRADEKIREKIVDYIETVKSNREEQ